GARAPPAQRHRHQGELRRAGLHGHGPQRLSRDANDSGGSRRAGPPGVARGGWADRQLLGRERNRSLVAVLGESSGAPPVEAPFPAPAATFATFGIQRFRSMSRLLFA